MFSVIKWQVQILINSFTMIFNFLNLYLERCCGSGYTGPSDSGPTSRCIRTRIRVPSIAVCGYGFGCGSNLSLGPDMDSDPGPIHRCILIWIRIRVPSIAGSGYGFGSPFIWENRLRNLWNRIYLKKNNGCRIFVDAFCTLRAFLHLLFFIIWHSLIRTQIKLPTGVWSL